MFLLFNSSDTLRIAARPKRVLFTNEIWKSYPTYDSYELGTAQRSLIFRIGLRKRGVRGRIASRPKRPLAHHRAPLPNT